MFRLITIIVCFTFLEVTHATNTSNHKNSIFKIICISNTYDFLAPYQAPTETEGIGTGFLIEGNKIITNAHVVKNHAVLKIRKSNETKRYKAVVEHVGEDCDLAILSVKDPEFFQGLEPLKLGDPQKLKTPVDVYGFPIGGTEITVTSGVISRIQMAGYVHSGVELLTYQIDAAMNPGNSGGPVIANGKVIGVAHQGSEEGQNINYIIPVEILTHFLKGAESGHYQGFPAPPFLRTQELENPDLRKYFKLATNESGVRITWVAADSYAKDFLRPNDIIQTIDGVKIQNDGNIIYDNDLVLPANYLWTKKYLNETMKIDLLREGKPVTIHLPLKLSILEISKLYRFTDARPRYFIFGGFVFQPYTHDFYIQAKHEENSNFKLLSNQVDSDYFFHETIPERVVLTRKLSDEINENYDDLVDSVITNANGKDVQTLQDLIAAIDNNPADYHLLTTSTGADIILYKKELKEANKRILEKYQIFSDRYL